MNSNNQYRIAAREYLSNYFLPETGQHIYHSAFLGGHGNLLGYQQYRFAGQHCFFNNFEVRFKIADVGGYIMLNGTLNHKDSMGYNTIVHKDYVQIMGASSGLFHEEHNIGNDVVNFQIWVQPKLQNTTPRYQQRFFQKTNEKIKSPR